MQKKIDWEDNGLLNNYKTQTAAVKSGNDWENPQMLGENKLPAAAYRRYSPEYRRSLNGDWLFRYSLTPAAAPAGFEKPDFDVSTWKTIPVPSHMELQGYGIPIYTNIQYPFPPTQPTVPEENPVGCYRRDFELPANWNGRRTFISFQGVDSFFYLWLNGEFVGSSKVSRSPAEFELTPFLKPGQNTLAVKVFRWSDATYIEDQDMWWLSGIFREVYLFSTPACRIQDFEVQTQLDESYLDAALQVTTKLDGDSAGHRVKTTLFNGDKIICSGFETEYQIANPHKWTAETPHLYRLKIELQNSSGATIETIQQPVGFRSVEIRGGEFLINGVSVLLRGVNRHEFNCKTGRAITEDDMMTDIMLMKSHNLNAVRTSHYPAQSRWYELCDEYGLYVLDEADCETHGYRSELACDPNWEAAFLDRAVRMLERDKNHPSVVIWSLGNESGFGPNIITCADWVHRRDPSRPLNYFHAGVEPCVDIIGLHYPTLEAVMKMVAEEPSGRPILLEEYAHSMGNSTGNMREYWEMIENTPRLIGGFIWDWIDQGLERKTASGETWYAYGGDFGDQPNDHQFCLNGIIAPDRRAKPSLLDLKHTFRPFVFALNDCGNITVKNRYSFCNLSEFKIHWSLQIEDKIVASGVLEKVDCPPGEAREVRVPYPEFDCGANVYLNIAEDQIQLSAAPVKVAAASSKFDLKQIVSGLQFQVWRAPTNNDRPFIPLWREAGYDKPDLREIFAVTEEYEFHDDGSIDLQYTVEPLKANLPCLPRLGMRLILPLEFDRFEWFGRGPYETYCDRKLSARIGHYTGSVDDQYEPYVVPQDNGNKTDVLWAAVTNAAGQGFKVVPDRPMDTSIHYYTAEEFTAAQHTHELGEKTKIVWNLDYAMAGIGNGSHGPGTLPQYQVKPQKITCRLRFIPISGT